MTAVRPRVRIGILANNENDCASIDSWLGVGEQGLGCFDKAKQHASGNACDSSCLYNNSVGCDNGNGLSNITAFTYVFVR